MQKNLGSMPTGGYENLKTVPGVSKGSVYVVVAENKEVLVSVKPEVALVYFDDTRRFFQIGFRIHVRPQEGKHLGDRDVLSKRLNIGLLAKRGLADGTSDEGGERYVGQMRIPVCNLTMSPWVVQEAIVEGQLIEKLANTLYDRLEGAELIATSSREAFINAAKERFLDMIPDNKVPLPEVKVYFGKESYYANGSSPPTDPPTHIGGEDDDDS